MGSPEVDLNMEEVATEPRTSGKKSRLDRASQQLSETLAAVAAVGDGWRGHAVAVIATAVPVSVFAAFWEGRERGWGYVAFALALYGAIWLLLIFLLGLSNRRYVRRLAARAAAEGHAVEVREDWREVVARIRYRWDGPQMLDPERYVNAREHPCGCRTVFDLIEDRDKPRRACDGHLAGWQDRGFAPPTPGSSKGDNRG